MEGHQKGLELVAPFLTKPQINELCSGRLWEEYKERRMRLFQAQLKRALWRQRQYARQSGSLETRRVEGVGCHKGKVDEFLHALFQRRYGLDCWQDPDFRKDCYKKTPEIRVPEPARRVLVNGFRPAGMVPGENPGTATLESKNGASDRVPRGVKVAHETPARASQ
jgi:hypothetical protein